MEIQFWSNWQNEVCPKISLFTSDWVRDKLKGTKEVVEGLWKRNPKKENFM